VVGARLASCPWLPALLSATPGFRAEKTHFHGINKTLS
jgi:hypothetical protein